MGSSVNVLFWVRPDFHRYPGGDSVQVKWSAKALEELGWRVVISSDPDLDVSEFHVIHLWHLERCHDTWLFYERARMSRLPIILSTIYWPSDHRPLIGSGHKVFRNGIENFKNLVRLLGSHSAENRRFIVAALRRGWLHCRDRLLNDVDLLLPNSRSEARILHREKSSNTPVMVIPNVVDPRVVDAVRKLPWEERDLILCVGHFCPRKNQRLLIEAMKETGLSITFVGGARPMHRSYLQSCRKAGEGRHRFLGAISYDTVLELMGRAKAHVQVSTLETPGLVNLEAALMGCNLVLPPVDPVKDYFGVLGNYFQSYHPESVRQAVERAMDHPQDGVERHVRDHFTLEQLKHSLYEAYRHVLKDCRTPPV